VRLIDSHCHIQADAFGADAGAVVAAARSAGVERILVPGWDLVSSAAAVEAAPTLGVDAAAGIHPHTAADASEADWAAIVQLVDDERVVAVGETGLDYDRAFSPRDVQLANLRRHFALSAAVGKPVIIHCRSKPGERDAQDDLLRELAAAGAGTARWPTAGGRPPALLHSFSGPVDYAEQALEMGLAISLSGLVFREGEEASTAVAAFVPADRLLIETDSPYLSPPGAPRRRNEPIWVEVTAGWLAERRGMYMEELGEALVANYDRIFGGAVSRPPS
jgi:TatD DNase family protein